MYEDLKFNPLQAVQKVKGYQWPGVVVSAFHTLDGKARYVVECTVPAVSGALHIFSGDQLELIKIK